MRHPSALLVSLSLLAALAAPAMPARAQGMQSPGQWYINQNIYSTRVFNGVIANSMIDAKRKAAADAANTGSANQPPQPAEATRFVPAAARIAPARMAGRNAGSADARRAVQASYDAHLDLYERTARNDGYPPNDLAYAYQYFVVNAYQVYHDLVNVPLDRDPYLRGARDGFDRITLAARKRQAQVSASQERAIYQQFRRELGASAEVRRMSDAEKQEATEMLAISFGVTFDAYMRAINSGDDALRDEARRAARTGLEKMLGRPVDRIHVGYNGLEGGSAGEPE